MKIKFYYYSTKYNEDISLYITPCISLFLYREFMYNSYTISFAWLVFNFNMEITIDKQQDYGRNT